MSVNPQFSFSLPVIPYTRTPVKTDEPLNNLSSISNNLPPSVINAEGDKFVKKDKEGKEPGNKTLSFKGIAIDKKVVVAVAAGALAAAGAVYVVMRNKNASSLRRVQNEFQNTIHDIERNARRQAQDSLSDLQDTARKKMSDAEELQRKLQTSINEGIQAATKGHDAELQRLNNAISASSDTPLDKKLYSELKKQIDAYALDYDIQTPFVPKKWTSSKTPNTDFIPFVKSNNRANMKPLEVPEFTWGQKWSFEVPANDTIRPSVADKIEFTPTKAQTSISMKYADSVKWDDDKIARDILQNFYDGHGQTLDGVKFDVTPLANGKSRVKIEGRGLYTPDKAILLGESSKSENATAAGSYGEGLKMAVLKLLKDKGADDVKIGADGWRVIYDAVDSNVDHSKKVLQYTLEKAEQSFNGNYVEFETKSPELVKSIRESLSHFYHSGNTDFATPDFENTLFGIKKVADRGRVYMCGQRFEYKDKGKWDGLEKITVFFKEKTDAFDPSRDRVALSDDNLEKIMRHFASNDKTTKAEVFQALRSLESEWSKCGDAKSAPRSLINALIAAADKKDMVINFPKEYVAYSRYPQVSEDIYMDLIAKGYKICNENFSDIGMKSAADFVQDARAHGSFVPTDIQTKKIGILRTAVQKFAKYLGKEFEPSELNPKIYLFDAKSVNEARTYEDTLAEAIIERGTSRGFWIDRKYLNETSFPDALSTTLHEMTHKAGGDSSAEFSYKLTDVMKKVTEAISDGKNPTLGVEMSNMQKLWNELSAAAPAV